MERVFQLLEDAPRRKDWVIAQASDLVPPGMGWRDREIARRFNRKDSSVPVGPTHSEVTDAAIRVGQRRVLTKYIWASIRDGRLIEYWQDDEKWLRKAEKKPYKMTPARLAAARISLAKARKVQWSRLTPEQRSEKARRASLSITPEQRSERTRRGMMAQTPEQRHERAVRAAQSQTPEQHRERGLKGAQALTPEQRSERVLRGWANISPEKREERNRKLSAALKAAWRRRRAESE